MNEIAMDKMRNEIENIFLKVEQTVFPDRLRHWRERRRAKGCFQDFGLDN